MISEIQGIWERLSTKTKLLLGGYLVLILIGISFKLVGLTFLLFTFSPIIIVLILLTTKGKDEIDVFFVYIVIATIQLGYYIGYLWVDVIEYSLERDISTMIVISIVYVVVSLGLIYFMLKRFVFMNEIVRRILYSAYFLAYYLVSLLLAWTLAWAGVL